MQVKSGFRVLLVTFNALVQIHERPFRKEIRGNLNKSKRSISNLIIFTPANTLSISFFLIAFVLLFSKTTNLNGGSAYSNISLRTLSILTLALIASIAGIASTERAPLRINSKHVEAYSDENEIQSFRKSLNYIRFFLILCLFGNLVLMSIQPSIWFAAPQNIVKLRTIPGITTLTQLAPLVVSFIYLGHKLKMITKLEMNLALLLGLLSMWRSFINSERLTIVELAVPILILHIYFRKKPPGKIQKYLIGASLFFLFYLLFLVQEMFRSWATYRYRSELNIFEFSFDRLINYYASSVRNGQFLVDRPDIAGSYTGNLDFLYQFPLFGTLVENSNAGQQWFGVLTSGFGSPEFNTATSALTLSSEFGLIGMVLFFFCLFRLFTKLLYRIEKGSLVSLGVYASTLTGLLELPRLNWFTLGRTFPLLIGSLFIYIIYSKRISRTL